MYDLYWSLCKPIMCPITRLHRLQSLPPQPAFDLKKWHNALERDKQSKAWGLNQPCGWLDGAQSKAKANSRLWRVFEIGNYVIKALKHQWSICPSVTCAPCKLVTCCGPVFFFSEASQFDRCFFPGNIWRNQNTTKSNICIKQREAHQIGRLEVDQKKILKGGIDKLSTLGGWAPELLLRELAIGRQSRLAVTYPCNPFF